LNLSSEARTVDKGLYIVPFYESYEAAIYMLANGVKTTLIVRVLFDRGRRRLGLPSGMCPSSVHWP